MSFKYPKVSGCCKLPSKWHRGNGTETPCGVATGVQGEQLAKQADLKWIFEDLAPVSRIFE
ncbi:hypothetical protein DFR52_101940 [Hoeflea marina]|uniref:Uncharacterized protein n=1 Tax=Hoeflea marina TaxID=274592 RepID=A0A317PVE0_9HYPH|nr:hypothetical protein DFR52_101940 [Hoeflea marina]